MKIFGQPSNYSEILQRIWYTSLATGILCTAVLAKASPDIQALIDSISTKADIGPIKNIKVLYILIPVLISVLSRMLKLHDKISDVFRIRYLFDTRFLLFPLAILSGINLTSDLRKKIGHNRINSMYSVFYPYANFENPVIDKQLVRTSADNWGWFWALVESFALIVVTTVALIFIDKKDYLLLCFFALLVELLLIVMFGGFCVRGARRQVAAILADKNRKKEIGKYFRSL